ncbi:protein S40-1-like [Prosopis cineraria]|uniref:protein S40-1-like n=1 Tax=Prosopis cineraria TaxID=364024 RepID=UPI0024102DE8|nr:protein S40-1-like [Prosopis cineraria]
MKVKSDTQTQGGREGGDRTQRLYGDASTHNPIKLPSTSFLISICINNKAPNPLPSSLFYHSLLVFSIMADEFQESDVVFSDHYHRHASPDVVDDHDSCYSDNYRQVTVQPPQQQWNSRNKSTKSRKSSRKIVANSLPVNIPESIFRCMDREEQLEEEWEDEGMVPPHVIVGRRIAGKMAFSVCTGNGRTLKGRDLSRVRNSILRMTGFLET